MRKPQFVEHILLWMCYFCYDHSRFCYRLLDVVYDHSRTKPLTNVVWVEFLRFFHNWTNNIWIEFV